MTIGRVLNFHEGFYKCSISGAGESPVSWLNVTGSSKKESHPATPWIIVTVLLGVVLVVGALRHFGKDYWDRALLYLSTKVRTSDSTERQTEASAPNASRATYATVNKNRKKTDEDGLSSGPCYYLVEQEYAEVNEEPEKSTARRTSSHVYQLVADDTFYSVLQEAMVMDTPVRLYFAKRNCLEQEKLRNCCKSSPPPMILLLIRRTRSK
uniref:uncharacterized protein LOC101469357 n=1 Tax=Maylandia zebra TaxID=106582 RepID=UPI000D30667B|nr:uncharacterized protein LOC101469357 [Maylandia zebra]